LTFFQALLVGLEMFTYSCHVFADAEHSFQFIMLMWKMIASTQNATDNALWIQSRMQNYSYIISNSVKTCWNKAKTWLCCFQDTWI